MLWRGRARSGKWTSDDTVQFCTEVARSERFELPTLGIEIRCSIQLSYERLMTPDIGPQTEAPHT